MSMLNVSTESIDRVGRRETFLKSNFESLEGETVRPEKEVKNKNRYEKVADLCRLLITFGCDRCRFELFFSSLSSCIVLLDMHSQFVFFFYSISYKFNARNKDSQVSNKREELLKRIEETRKKLQSVSLQLIAIAD